ncbi:MAG TPA: hypothetical protein VFU47_01275, partial [Armatimonadota bacterium]|nr:hypothetical protein [Armatimonadota bacterium]
LAALLVLGLAGAARGLQQAAPPEVPPLILEDFETATIGARPYLWREAKQGAMQATLGAEKAELDGSDANKGLKLEYTFPATFAEGQGVEAGPGLRPGSAGQPLPGSMTALSLMVYGDASKNGIGVRLRDRSGERFEWQTPVTWTGWRKMEIPLDPKTAARSGARANGVLDLPLTFDAVRVARLPGGAAKGETLVDNLTAICRFARVTTLYDTRDGAKLDGWQAHRNRSTVGTVSESLVPRAGKDVPALKLEYEYENAGDASVEYSHTLPAGEGHGTLLADVFGDGSNNILRFRMLDGEGHPWQATSATILVDWSGWKTLYVDTRTLRDPSGPDPSAPLEKFPVRFQSLIIDDCSPGDALPGVESGRKGEIYLGRLLFGAER